MKHTKEDIKFMEITASKGNHDKTYKQLLDTIETYQRALNQAWPDDLDKYNRIKPFLELLLNLNSLIQTQAGLICAYSDVNNAEKQINTLKEEINRYRRMCQYFNIDPRKNQYF